jgi:4-aminobutyrate aminotransferase-like enzyme
MDTNSYRPEYAEALPEETRLLTQKREELLGGAYRLFYRDPVHLVRGRGQYVWDAAGQKYLDVYNNVVSIGHCHPAVVEAVTKQMSELNTHTRYLHENILDYTEALMRTLPPELDKAMYMCTGSEANDLAIRVAQQASGGTGIIVTEEAYHGTSALTSGMSPALGSGQPIADFVRLVPAPDSYRVTDADLGTWFAARVQDVIDDMARNGIVFAGMLADSIFSSDGVFPDPVGFLAPVLETVHRNGGIYIADEVQPGFARTGDAFWGFARQGIVPDIMTTGKPMGNGFPTSALVAKGDVLAAFSDRLPYFNTFGGNPVAMAAAQAVLRVMDEEGLQEHARVTGAKLKASLEELAATHPSVGDVRGAGLFIGFELVSDRDGKTPDQQLALNVIEELREHHHILTSVAGSHGNVLKLRPPLPFNDTTDIDWLVGALDETLSGYGV